MLNNKASTKTSHAIDEANSFYLYRRLLSYALVYWRIFIFAILGMIVVAAASTAFTALMKPMMDGSFVKRDPETIKWIPIAIIGIFLFRVVGAFLALIDLYFDQRRSVTPKSSS